jgi:glutamate--cysteine ligase catalytic subunit
MISIFILIVYRDSSSPSPFRDVLFEKEESIIDDHIHLDSAVGGLGCCCLQVTFQAQSFNESLHLYDQLLPLTGILVSFSLFFVTNLEV